MISPVVMFSFLVLIFAEEANGGGSGSNPGCGTNGFSAAAGWDPVTGKLEVFPFKLHKLTYSMSGLGSPNYTALRIAAGL